MKNNAFFNSMYHIGCEWQERHEVRKRLKETLIAQYGYGSPELEAWYAEKTETVNPEVVR